jgi:hypothetical protein
MSLCVCLGDSARDLVFCFLFMCSIFVSFAADKCDHFLFKDHNIPGKLRKEHIFGGLRTN